jgi:PIN domain nuclease of toxin-antitoxin system
MNLLLDMHIFLWYITADKRLPSPMSEAIRDKDNQVYLSVVSIWECVVKYKLGKLPLPQSPEIYLVRQRQQHQIDSLQLDEASVSQLAHLPDHHRDPFDRMLLCQAMAHGLTLMTMDHLLEQYKVLQFSASS